jgi:hypothetical protein
MVAPTFGNRLMSANFPLQALNITAKVAELVS